MSIETRIAKLEASAATDRQCPHAYVWIEEDDALPPLPPLCEECGQPFRARINIRRYADEAGEQTRLREDEL